MIKSLPFRAFIFNAIDFTRRQSHVTIGFFRYVISCFFLCRRYERPISEDNGEIGLLVDFFLSLFSLYKKKPNIKNSSLYRFARKLNSINMQFLIMHYSAIQERKIFLLFENRRYNLIFSIIFYVFFFYVEDKSRYTISNDLHRIFSLVRCLIFLTSS